MRAVARANGEGEIVVNVFEEWIEQNPVQPIHLTTNLPHAPHAPKKLWLLGNVICNKAQLNARIERMSNPVTVIDLHDACMGVYLTKEYGYAFIDNGWVYPITSGKSFYDLRRETYQKRYSLKSLTHLSQIAFKSLKPLFKAENIKFGHDFDVELKEDFKTEQSILF